MAGDMEPGSTYSLPTAFVFVFNLVIGVGALSLPYGFLQAGMVSGVLVLILVAVLSYIGVCFVIESNACALALSRVEGEVNHSVQMDEASSLVGDDDTKLFEIDQRLELGVISKVCFGEIGKNLFYVVLVIYLYGDLSVYAAIVPTSVSKVYCLGACATNTVYYLTILAFTICVVPFSLFNFQRTKYLQMVTLFLRNFALTCMIILSIVQVTKNAKEDPNPVADDVRVFSYKALPFLFGTSIYAFMCHHSLPSIITPIENKKNIFKMFFADFFFIFVVYILLCFTAVFAYGCGLESVLSYQFIDQISDASKGLKVLYYFLGLYPVFTLSTNYPLISITLRNNLMNLITYKADHPRWSKYRSYVFSLLAALPPIGVALATSNVSKLVSFTGSYAGLGIMLIIPALLVIFARKRLAAKLPTARNPYQSIFSHNLWAYIVLVCSAIALVLITLYLAMSPPNECTVSTSSS